MSASKHTPGPWRVSGHRLAVFTKLNGINVVVADCDRTLGYSESEANARLIASAPDLLEALKLWLDIHDKPAGFIGKFGKSLTEAIAAQEVKVNAAAAAARAAIAKAGGTA